MNSSRNTPEPGHYKYSYSTCDEEVDCNRTSFSSIVPTNIMNPNDYSHKRKKINNKMSTKSDVSYISNNQ